MSLRGARGTLVLWSASSWPSWVAAYACTHTLPDSGEGYSPGVRTKYKEDFGIDRISSSAFGANAADLELKVLAFNVLVLYQRQALGWSVLQRAKTLRRRVLALAGQLIRTAGRWVLKLAEGWAGHADLGRARQHLATLGP